MQTRRRSWATVVAAILLVVFGLTARGESLAAFDGRCILAGWVAPPSNIPDILGRRALPARRLARLDATPDFRHGLLRVETDGPGEKLARKAQFAGFACEPCLFARSAGRLRLRTWQRPLGDFSAIFKHRSRYAI